MNDTVLIANRGEIAVRLLRAARALGLRTVAVFSEADRGAPHVRLADEAVLLGPAAPSESYLRGDAIVAAALATGAHMIHPGYGFLSEDADFAESVERAGLVFVGPTPHQLRVFGTKHTARTAAVAAGVPVFPGSGLLNSPDEAVAAAESIGYPVMLKATGGGGGIGMQVCRTAEDMRTAFDRVTRLAARSFGAAGVFVERFVEHARHVEVQIFGDGEGRVVSLGDRDCSLQRRNQKVMEEAPAPALPEHIRSQLHSSSRTLAASIDYRSAGTVEFIYDPRRQEASFLEVNARLQVEHPVTEAVTGVDLAQWMFRLARGEGDVLAAYLSPGSARGEVPVRGHAVEARVYAEDPSRDYRPSTGTLTAVTFPTQDDVRVDTWVEQGTDVSAFYDPLLAKVIAAGSDRDEALDRLGAALDGTILHGIEVNVGLLRAAVDRADVREASHSTSTLTEIVDPRPRVTVERPGLMTTVQDLPGRIGLWDVGVPPSGPMDDLSFRLGNLALGNDDGAPGLECTATGPALRVTHPTTVCVTGAECAVTVDGSPVPMWEPVEVPAGALLDVGAAETTGLRTYVLVAGGFDVPEYLGSASTFTLGRFGGHGGRQLVVGDVLRAAPRSAAVRPVGPVAPEVRPAIPSEWNLAVTEGPHGAPEFFTRADIQTLFEASYRVHFNSARTGVRLEGPRPEWARPDGGDAGLHPSNIHDTAYSVGALDFTGDTPILLGPDGPSLGGFVCPVTVVSADRWKLGQLRPGDTVRFVPVGAAAAPSRRDVGTTRGAASSVVRSGGDGDDGVLGRRAVDGAPSVTYRRNGDDNVLIEYGDMVLDLALRARVHALHRRIQSEIAGGSVHGILDLTPGIRSLQVHVDPDRLPIDRLLGLLAELEDELPGTSELVVPSRSVRLPLSWDDPATREAIARYTSGVRDDAPWCPSNIEFIRRVNGLASQADVMDVVFSAEYLTLGLGDVYLGAPVATPLDPRHRLVTTKYNPARTWTAENSVGIGGAYLCIYGMEGPGGYQFVGRTTQVWSRYRHTTPFEPGSPWLLRFFDRISWYPVSADELLDLRADLAAGRGSVDITEGTFSLAEHERFLADNATSIAEFRERQGAAFAAERAAWAAAGEFDRAERAESLAEPPIADLILDDGEQRVDAPFASSVWKVDVEVGESVVAGQSLLALEAMKMETVMRAPTDGIVTQILVQAGHQVDPGAALVVVGPPSAACDAAGIPA
jgi:urea carboxylase